LVAVRLQGQFSRKFPDQPKIWFIRSSSTERPFVLCLSSGSRTRVFGAGGERKSGDPKEKPSDQK